MVVNDTEISLAEIEAAYTKTLDKIFPMKAPRKEKKDVRMPLTPMIFR